MAAPWNLPTVAVRIAAGQGSGENLDNLTWTDITGQVRAVDGLRFSRGRGRVDEPPVSGTLTVTLDNTDGRYTPGRSDGPHGDGFKARIPIQVTATPGSLAVVGRTWSDEWAATEFGPTEVMGASTPWAGEWSTTDFGPHALGTFPVWTGFITDIDAVVAGEPRVLVQAADTVSRAAKIVCRPWPGSTVDNLATADQPSHYWPLQERAYNAAGDPITLAADARGGRTLTLEETFKPNTTTLAVGEFEAEGPTVDDTALLLTPQWTSGSSAYIVDGGKALVGQIPVAAAGGGIAAAAWLRLDPQIDAANQNQVDAWLYLGRTPRPDIPPQLDFSIVWSMLAEHPGRRAAYLSLFVLQPDYTMFVTYHGPLTGVYGGGWHHVAYSVDETATTPAARFRAWLDGAEVPLFATRGVLDTDNDFPEGMWQFYVGQNATGQYLGGAVAHYCLWTQQPAGGFPTIPLQIAGMAAAAPTTGDRFAALVRATASAAAIGSWLAADTAARKPVAAQATGKRYLLDLLAEVAAVERGTLHAEADGRIRLASARSRLTDTVTLTVSAAGGVLELQGAFGVDDAGAVDEATVTTADGTTCTGTRIGGTGLESTSLTLATDDRVHAQSVADGVANHPADEVRAPTLTVSVDALASISQTAAATAVGIDVGDLIRVTGLDTTWAPASTIDLVVDRVSHDISKDGWRITLDTSPGATAVGAAVGTAGTLSTVSATLKIRPA